MKSLPYIETHKESPKSLLVELNRLTISNGYTNETNMKKSERDAKKIKLYAQALGRLGGMAGTGKAKARPSEVCRKAVMKRWDDWRKLKGEAETKVSMTTKPKANA
jgi:hypothetical protein